MRVLVSLVDFILRVVGSYEGFYRGDGMSCKVCYGCYIEKGLEVGFGEVGRYVGRYRRYLGF